MMHKKTSLDKGPEGERRPASGAAQARLRILATTDLHMHLLAYDYFNSDRDAPFGMARVATKIAQHRATVPNCLLFDNGDLLQGNLLGDYLAAGDRDGPHPATTYLAQLGYDAITLGNHDFSYGLCHLDHALAGLRCPVVLANAETPGRKPPFQPWVMLRRMLICEDGNSRALQLGVIGFLPPQTPQWEPHLAGRLTCSDILDTARRYLPQMRAAGCEVIVALCHGGIEAGHHPAHAENVAAELAALDVDVVVAGHTHLVFPGPDIAPSPGIDPLRGQLCGKPAVMPGFWGSHLGVIDLALAHDGVSWRITHHEVRAEACNTTPPSPDLPAQLLATHHAARRHYSRKTGHSAVALQSHFAQLGQDAGLALIATASRWFLRGALESTATDGLPIVTALAPLRSGGRGGPAHYTNVPAGPLSLHSLTDLYLFTNHIAALVATGAMLHDWLERAAGQFHRLRPGQPEGDLLDPRFPGYNFDLIAGLEWQFDLSEPALYTPSGQPLGAGPGRVRNLSFRGRPVSANQRFILCTNSYRLGGHGLYAPLTRDAVQLLADGPRMRDVLARYLRHNPDVAPQAGLGWGFAPIAGASALYRTGPGVPAPPALSLTSLGEDDAGFALFRLQL